MEGEMPLPRRVQELRGTKRARDEGFVPASKKLLRRGNKRGSAEWPPTSSDIKRRLSASPSSLSDTERSIMRAIDKTYSPRPPPPPPPQSRRTSVKTVHRQSALRDAENQILRDLRLPTADAAARRAEWVFGKRKRVDDKGITRSSKRFKRPSPPPMTEESFGNKRKHREPPSFHRKIQRGEEEADSRDDDNRVGVGIDGDA